MPVVGDAQAQDSLFSYERNGVVVRHLVVDKRADAPDQRHAACHRRIGGQQNGWARRAVRGDAPPRGAGRGKGHDSRRFEGASEIHGSAALDDKALKAALSQYLASPPRRIDRLIFQALLGAGAHALKPEKLLGLGGAGRTAQAAR